MKYVLILLSLCLLGCTSKPQFTYKAWDLPQIPIKYKQKVNGYNVSVLCFLGDSVAYDQNKALFYFENDSSYFYVYNPSFHIGMLLGEDFQIGDLLISPFHISHDAAEPVAYRIACGEKKMAVATDLGVYTDYTIEHLKDV